MITCQQRCKIYCGCFPNIYRYATALDSFPAPHGLVLGQMLLDIVGSLGLFHDPPATRVVHQAFSHSIVMSHSFWEHKCNGLLDHTQRLSLPEWADGTGKMPAREPSRCASLHGIDSIGNIRPTHLREQDLAATGCA